MTSEYVENKLHLEETDNKVCKVFGIVTNEEASPIDLLLWHRKRCRNSEQEHSRLTHDMAGGRFPSDSFGENAAWWYMSIIALNLLKLFQQHTLPSRYRRSRIKRLNSVMLRVAVKVLKRSRSCFIRIRHDHPLYDLIPVAREKMIRIRNALKDSEIWIQDKALLL